IEMMVVIKFTPPRIVPNPCNPSPKTQMSPPIPGEYVALDSGAYPNQPNAAAPCGVRNPAQAINEPNRKNQNARAFSRGKATSGAPICNGIITFAKPINSGVANISNISVPCIVNNWLNCSLVCKICMPGSNNSARMINAITPARQKNVNDAIRYMYPIVLWSVEVNQFTIMRPLETGTTCGRTRD